MSKKCKAIETLTLAEGNASVHHDDYTASQQEIVETELFGTP